MNFILKYTSLNLIEYTLLSLSATLALLVFLLKSLDMERAGVAAFLLVVMISLNMFYAITSGKWAMGIAISLLSVIYLGILISLMDSYPGAELVMLLAMFLIPIVAFQVIRSTSTTTTEKPIRLMIYAIASFIIAYNILPFFLMAALSDTAFMLTYYRYFIFVIVLVLLHISYNFDKVEKTVKGGLKCLLAYYGLMVYAFLAGSF